MFGSGISLADIAAVTKNNEDGLGNGNGWWVLIILLALFGGWGNNGYGNNRGCGESSNGNGGNGVTYMIGADVQRGFDTESIRSKLDGINSGLCSMGYDQLAQMNNINTNIMQTGYNIGDKIQQAAIASMQQSNSLMSTIDRCCCENRQGQADIKYTMSQDTCSITRAIEQAAQNIIQSGHDDYRRLHDEIVELRFQDMRDQLARKDTVINDMSRDRSQSQQTNEIINTILGRLVAGGVLPGNA